MCYFSPIVVSDISFLKDELKLISVALLELSKQVQAILLNIAIIIRAVDPNLAKVIRPEQLPQMPMTELPQHKVMEKFLKNPTNFAAVVSKSQCILVNHLNLLFHLLYLCFFFHSVTDSGWNQLVTMMNGKQLVKFWLDYTQIKWRRI